MELKEVAEYLGLKEDDIKTMDDFKAKFDTTFIRTSAINEDFEPVKKIVGKIYGTLENEIKKVAKANELELDFDSDELKGKKVTEKLKFAFEQYTGKTKTIIEELTTKASQGNDDKVKEWEKKYEKLNTKFTETDGLLKTTTSEFNQFKEIKERDIKNIHLNIKKDDIFKTAKFIPEVNEYTKKGFINEFQEKYSLDLDETGTPIITDKEGKRIPNPKVTGSFYDPADLLKEEMVKAKLYALNDDGGKKKPEQRQQQQQQNGQAKTNGRQVASPFN